MSIDTPKSAARKKAEEAAQKDKQAGRVCDCARWYASKHSAWCAWYQKECGRLEGLDDLGR